MYKVLDAQMNAINGGTFNYAEYQDKWTPLVLNVQVCKRGYHLTSEPWEWYKKNAVVYTAEGQGAQETEADKTVYSSVRIGEISNYYTGQFRRLEEIYDIFQAVESENIIAEPTHRGITALQVAHNHKQRVLPAATQYDSMADAMVFSVPQKRTLWGEDSLLHDVLLITTCTIMHYVRGTYDGIEMKRLAGIKHIMENFDQYVENRMRIVGFTTHEATIETILVK